MRIVLKVTAGPFAGRLFRFTGHDTFLVGRSKHTHFRLPTSDRTCSRIHFMIEINPPHCRLMDMGSNNGTYVNDRRVTVAELKHGDKIRAGRNILRIGVQQAPQRPVGEPTVEPAPPAETFVPPIPAKQPSGEDPQRPQIPGYQWRQALGAGNMGVVYLVEMADGSLAALKTIKTADTATSLDVERFLREAAILRNLAHPHIVGFRDMGESAGKPYFVMEYVPGHDASTLVKEQGPMTPARAVALTCQLLEALEYAHGRRFVHRDVKPSNLLVYEENGRELVKLADFGLARVYQESQLSGLTMDGDVGGTPSFMAPEQLLNYRYSPPSADIYSATATLYYLLRGSTSAMRPKTSISCSRRF